jgi:small-conductance mechanosensitive channel
MTVTNTTQHRIDRSELSITLSGNIPAQEALKIMNRALKTTEGILPKPAPFTRVSRFDSDGVVYKLFYWIENTKVVDREIRHALLEHITSEFVSAGISLSRNRTAEEEMALLNTLENLQ